MKDALLKLFEEMGFLNFDIKNWISPDGKIEDGEKEIGTMNDLEKTCYSLLQESHKNHKALHQKMRFTENEEERRAAEVEHTKCHCKEEILKSIMFGSIRTRIGQLPENTDGIALREDFTIVAVPEEDSLQFMGGIMVIDGFPFPFPFHGRR